MHGRDQYTPPSSNVDGRLSPTARPRRPILLRTLAIYYGLSSVSTVTVNGLLLTGFLPPPGDLEAQWAELGLPFMITLVLLSGGLAAAVAVQLFRLRASSVRLFELLMAVTAVGYAYQWVQLGLSTGLVPAIVVFSIRLAIYAYLRRLRARSVLV